MIRLRAMTCGWVTGSLGGFLEGETGELRVPVPSYLVEHAKGKVVFDSGLHVETRSDPGGRLGYKAKLFKVELPPGEDLAARLGAIGIDTREIRFLVNSHLHFDHVGGNALLPNATLVVQRLEWDAGHDERLAQANGYDPRDYDLGHDVLAIDGEHDLFGDGSIVCLPTHGHTPGHQSLMVRLPTGAVVLTADACYLKRTLDDLHLPRVVHDRETMLASLRRLRAMREAGVRIFYGHDPEFWATVPQAPAEIG
jgi:glyoxylase-like metal-dependent hydrolase (beta-lactamase superfamily II)